VLINLLKLLNGNVVILNQEEFARFYLSFRLLLFHPINATFYNKNRKWKNACSLHRIGFPPKHIVCLLTLPEIANDNSSGKVSRPHPSTAYKIVKFSSKDESLHCMHNFDATSIVI